jgi:hypothetical protein
MDDVAGDLDGLLARAGEAAGDDPAKADAYRAAALGLWHGARQARDAAEDAAWTGVLPHLTGGAVTAWTDLPAEVWRALSPRQQAAVRERTENPYGESDPAVLAGLKEMVAKDPAGFKAMDLGALYGALAPADAAEWRALQEEARTSGNGARAELAYISTVSRAIDRVMPTGLVGEVDDEAFRSGAYKAIVDAENLGDGKLKASELADACGEFLSDWLGQKEPAESWQRLFDGLIGRKPVPKKTVPPKPVVKPRLNHRVDWSFVAEREAVGGKPKLELYVPQEDGVVFGRSGVTLGLGVDLGGLTVRDLTALGIEPALINKLSPYLGLKGQTALSFVKAKPMTLTLREVETLDRAVQEKELGSLIQKYDAESKVGAFVSLPAGTQTAIADVFFQYGTSGPKEAAPDFWGAITTGDWNKAHESLMDFHDDYPDRRKLEAGLLFDDIRAGRLPTASTITEK